jgi:hypothetical protein
LDPPVTCRAKFFIMVESKSMHARKTTDNE